MNRTEIGKTWRDQLLGEAFLATIYEAYEADPDRSYALTEADHQRAVQALGEIPPKQKALLEEAQGRYGENRAYAAKYGFICGLFAGFRRFFGGEKQADDDGFAELVENGLFMVPGMERHRSYLENQDRCNVICAEVSRALGEAQEEDLVSIDCAWDERTHHAAYVGFSYGCSMARDVIWDAVRKE